MATVPRCPGSVALCFDVSDCIERGEDRTRDFSRRVPLISRGHVSNPQRLKAEGCIDAEPNAGRNKDFLHNLNDYSGTRIEVSTFHIRACSQCACAPICRADRIAKTLSVVASKWLWQSMARTSMASVLRRGCRGDAGGCRAFVGLHREMGLCGSVSTLNRPQERTMIQLVVIDPSQVLVLGLMAQPSTVASFHFSLVLVSLLV